MANLANGSARATDGRGLVDQVRDALVSREADIITRLLPDGVARGGEWWALNPSRPDTHLGSFSVSIDGKAAGCWYDFATAERGDLFDLVRLVTGADFNGALRHLAHEVGIPVPDPRLTIKRPATGAVAEWKRREASGEARGSGCRNVDLAVAKALPISFLEGLGLKELPARARQGDKPAMPAAVVIPYRDADGRVIATRFRSDPVAKLGSFWKRGTKPIPYGLDRLSGDEPAVWLVEGESDCWCLWHSGVAAIGIPGASLWTDEWATLLPQSASLNVVQEPDAAGSALVDRLRASPLANRLRVVRLPTKDAADLWTSDPDPERFRAALAAASVIEHKPAEKNPSAITLRTHADRQRERTTPGPMIVDGLLPEGGIGALVALPGQGKTLASVELGRCIASGEAFAGRKVAMGAVVYLCPDAPASSERRMLAIPDDVAARIVTVTDAPRLPGGLMALRDAIERATRAIGMPVRLVVLDTWDAIREHSGGGYAEIDGAAEGTLSGLRLIASDLKCAFIIDQHATRQDNGRARGTVVFDARCDWIALAEQGGSSLTLKSIKCRDGEQGIVGTWTIQSATVGDRPVPVLALADESERAAVEADVESKERERQDMSLLRTAWILTQEGVPVTARELQGRTGRGTGTIARVADRLRGRGFMEASSYAPTASGIASLDAG